MINAETAKSKLSIVFLDLKRIVFIAFGAVEMMRFCIK